jgi:hypothetical protein
VTNQQSKRLPWWVWAIVIILACLAIASIVNFVFWTIIKIAVVLVLLRIFYLVVFSGRRRGGS